MTPAGAITNHGKTRILAGFGAVALVILAEQGDFIEYDLQDDVPGPALPEPAVPEPAEPEVDVHAEALAAYPKANAEALAFLAQLAALLAAP